MTTSVEDVYSVFYDKLEQDDEFFAYFEVSPEEALEIAKSRSRSYLREACVYLRMATELEFTLAFAQNKDGIEIFSDPITDDECDLLANIMRVIYYERNLAKLLSRLNIFGNAELKQLPYSPASERTSIVEMVNNERKQIDCLISRYAGMDRFSGARKIVDHTLPEESE